MSTPSFSDDPAALPRVCYLHIPKTGGQTLAARLAAAYPIGKADILGPTLSYPDGVEELKRLFTEKDFVERHVTGPVLMEFGGIDLLTTIREPVSHIVSNYLHVRRAPENWLHNVSKMLPPKEFFRQFGDFLGNAQSRYLAAAFFPQDVDPEPLRTLAAQIFDALDRIRWVVPTECVDDFVAQWALELRRRLRGADADLNVARRDHQYEDLLEIVRGRPDLYSVDLLLWQAARKRYAEYREGVLNAIVGVRAQNDASRAYWDRGSGIWLRNGWYAPQVGTSVGTAWWAGPGQYSEVTYLRTATERFVKFSVAVVYGVDYSRIAVVGADRVTRLPVVVQEREVGWDFWVDLGTEPTCGSFWFWVPEVWASAILDATAEDTDRKSFATCDWRFVGDGPDEDNASASSTAAGDVQPPT